MGADFSLFLWVHVLSLPLAPFLLLLPVSFAFPFMTIRWCEMAPSFNINECKTSLGALSSAVSGHMCGWLIGLLKSTQREVTDAGVGFRYQSGRLKIIFNSMLGASKTYLTVL